jgi:hypothetical protein
VFTRVSFPDCIRRNDRSRRKNAVVSNFTTIANQTTTPLETHRSRKKREKGERKEER